MIKLHSRIVVDSYELRDMTESDAVHAYIKRKVSSDLGRQLGDLADGVINVSAHKLPYGDIDYNLSITVITEEERQEYLKLKDLMYRLYGLLNEEEE